MAVVYGVSEVVFCLEVLGFQVAKSAPAHVIARENPGPETGIPVGRA